MEFMFWVWLAVIVVAIVVEIVTLDLISIWFAFGGVVPFILSAIGGIAIEIQISIFVIASVLLIIFLRKVAQKLLFKNMNTKTNIQAYEGKKYRLLEDTDLEKNGSIKINDVVWTAVGKDGEKIEKGSLVEITGTEGNKMIVKKVEEEIKEDKQKLVENEQKTKDKEVKEEE